MWWISQQKMKTKSIIDLHQNYPNPFNGSTTIKYNLRQAGNVHIKIYDILGRTVKTIATNEYNNSNTDYYTIWNGLNNHGARVASGNYFYSVYLNNTVKTKKMTLIKWTII